jgi:membrane associated rhomboid family serine protease
MLLLPIRTDRRLKTTPWINIALIVANVAIYFVTRTSSAGESTFDASPLYLQPMNAAWYQFITYQFLHDPISPWHLLGNMLFLYVFGNSVEDRLGKVGYLAFYLAGGVAAGLGHAMSSNAPVLGASGSVAAVTGAFLALFPLSNVTIFYFFFFIGTWQISSIYLILLQIGENLFMHLLSGGRGGVAYMAHLFGYGYGFFIGMTLLWARLLGREPYDMLTMWEHRRRRMKFRAMANSGYQPWQHEAGQTTDNGGIFRRAASAPATPPDPQSDRIIQLRGEVSRAVTAHDMDRATASYKQLLDVDGMQVMNQGVQQQLGNHYMHQGDYEDAARAYELYLNTYSAGDARDEISLLLALVYVRYLSRRQRARELLTAARSRITEGDQRRMIDQLLAEIES